MASSWSSSPDYAGFWARLGAFAIDALIVAVVLAPLAVLSSGNPWDFLVLLAIGVAVIGFWRYCGATPGKLAFGLKIVDARTGEPPTLLRLVLRYAGYVLSAFPLYLGFLWIAVDRRKQGWHDKIARTVVINSED